MANPSALGIFPPDTVRIETEDGWRQDWPWHCVDILGDEVVINVPLTHGRRRVVFYPYEHAAPCCVAHQLGRFFPPIRHSIAWTFHGSESFIVTCGPPQPAALQ